MRRYVAAMMSAAALAAPLAPLPAAAQMSAGPRFTAGVNQIVFQEDASGYGRALIDQLMPGRIAGWSSSGVTTRLAVAQIALRSGDPQPAFAVRIENAEMCDLRNGCLTFVFVLRGADWKPILQTKSTALGIGPYDPRSGMAGLFTDGMQRWDWDGQRYDVIN